MEKKLNCVLLVDDDDITNFINEKTLRKSAITEHIEVRLNGKEALDFLTDHDLYEKTGGTYPPPSLILLDINMPVMDGWEFLRDFENVALPPLQKPKIVILSTSCNPDDEQKAKSFNVVSEFMNKPLTQEMIEMLMNKYFL